MQSSKENFGNSESCWNTEMIETDKFRGKKLQFYLFCVFPHFDCENKLLL